MHTRDPGWASPVVREGIVTHSTVRLAAGAGVVAASLLIVGPNPAQAGADRPGGEQSADDFRNDGSNRRDSDAIRGPSNVMNDVLTGIGGTQQNSKPDLEPPPMVVGTGRGELEDLAVVDSFASEGQMALRSAAVAEAPVGDNVTAAVPGGRSDISGQPVTALRSPRVIIGNGRTPGTNVPRAGSAPEAVLMYDGLAAAGAAPALPTAIEINIPPLPPPLPPVERIRPAELVVEEFGTGTTDTVTDPLAGVAGLILIPAIGAVLGFRQARAAQSLRESIKA
jgi:hypothetical protein